MTPCVIMMLSYVSLVLQKVTSQVQLHLGLNRGWGKRDGHRVLAGNKRAEPRVNPSFDILIIGFNLHLRRISKQNITRTAFVWNSVMHHKQVTSQPDEPEMECLWTRDTEEALCQRPVESCIQRD